MKEVETLLCKYTTFPLSQSTDCDKLSTKLTVLQYLFT